MKNYLPYGLKPNDIRLNKAASESLETENAKLLAELEALKAKLAGASVTEDAPEEYTAAPKRSRRKAATEEGGEA
jgi:regulator of replication initiation timing